MKLTIFISLMLFASTFAFSQDLNKNALCKKWYLEKYEFFWIDYSPDDNEKNDYILLKDDMTYQSIDEGEFSQGKWSYNNTEKYFIIYDKNNQELKFMVSELTTKSLVVTADIEDMEYVNIYFKTK